MMNFEIALLLAKGPLTVPHSEYVESFGKTGN